MPAPTVYGSVLPAPGDEKRLRAEVGRHTRWGHEADAADARHRLALLRAVEALQAVRPTLRQAEREALHALIDGRQA